MDTLALGVIAIGVVAAIGVVLVAMNDGGKEQTEASAPPAAAPQPPPRPRPRARRRTQAVPTQVVTAPPYHGYATGAVPGQDPLVAGFMQVVSGELDSLRQQQERIDQRLKLINGIAELVHDMQAPGVATTTTVNTTNHRVSARSNHTASQG